MKSNLFLVLLSILVASPFFSVFSQEEEKENQFNVSFQYRPRAEYRNGYKVPLFEDEKSTAFINHRARLSMEYQRNGLSAGLSFQNISVWGENPVANSKHFNSVVNEAWAQLMSEDGLYAKFGRQMLHYNDGRLLSISNWNQASRYHDALKLGYLTKLNQLDLILAYNQDAERISGGTYYSGNGVPYKTMQAAYYQYNGLPNFTPSFIFINMGFENGDLLIGESKLAHLQTFGTNLIYKPTDDIRLTGIGYYQMGKRKLANENTSAFLLSLKGEFELTSQVKLTAATDYLSGEPNLQDDNNTFNAFNTLYAGNHGHYGVMDFFIDDPYQGGMNLGIWDNYLAVSYKPAPKFALGLTYHYFLTGSDVYYAGGEKMNRGLGSEIDFQFDYAIMKDVNLATGYSTFFGTPTMDFVKGGDHKVWQDWAYVMITVNPRIFSAKW